MDLVVFHYHFDTGGVTSVVTRAVRAFRAHLGREIGAIRLVGGRPAAALPPGLGCTCLTWPELDYLDPEAFVTGKAVKAARADAARLAGRLTRSFGGPDTLWWVHNHHLGKNPVFTQALLEAAAADPGQRVLLQIHDFPERARFANLRFLRRILTLSPYPIAPNIRYAVLNAGDRSLLLSAGLPARRVHVLENPAGPWDGSRGDRRTARRLLAGSAAAFSCRPSAPLLLYPVRAIRRKNVLEAGLLTRLLREEVNLAVTLPGTSGPERRYSQLVSKAYADRILRGLWKIGTLLPALGLDFPDLIAAADMVISTSVQEGFGYLFVDTLQWGLPLAARDLETLTGLKSLFRGYPARFYDRLLCPLSEERRGRLLELYREKLRGLTDLVPEGRLKELEAGFALLCGAGKVDFSYLPPRLQFQVLAALDRIEVLEECREANADLLEEIRDLLKTPAPPRREELEARFGHSGYARRFRRLYSDWPPPDASPPYACGPGIEEAVLAACLRTGSLRALYD